MTNTPTVRILIVEDEVLIAETVRTKLTKLGYEVPAIALTGEEALDVLEAAAPDVILMDIKLGGDLDGVTTAERIRERRQVPIIFVTAFSDDETIARVKRCSPYGYIIKPFQLNDLRTNIELALHRHAQEQAQRAQQQQLQQAMRYLHDAFLVADLEGVVLYANIHPDILPPAEAARLIGNRLSQLLEGPVAVAKLITTAHQQDHEAALPDGCQLHVPGGSIIPVSGNLQSVRNEEGVATGLLFNFRQTAPESLQVKPAIASELVNEAYSLHHKAQREWAYTLHEGLGQVLSAAKMNLDTVEVADGANHQLDQSKRLLDDAVGRVRKLTQAVMPNLLADFGLVPAVESLLRRMAAEDRRIRADIAPQPGRYPEVVEYHVYRLVQELVQALLAEQSVQQLTVRLSLDADAKHLVLALRAEPANQQLLREAALDTNAAYQDAKSRLRLVGGTLRWFPAAAGAHLLEVEIPAKGL